MATRSSRLTSAAERAAREQSAKAKLEAVHQQLAAGVAALHTDEDWRSWLRFAARMSGYSFGNRMLIMVQRPDATLVAGFRAWQAMGRHVDKGEKGIAILAPVVRRTTTDPDAPRTVPAAPPAPPDDEAAPGRQVVGFRVTYVFDVSQTTGAELPAQARVLTPAPDGLWQALVDYTAGRGFALARPAGIREDGYTDYSTHTVAVRQDLPDGHAVHTLAHEDAHVDLHDPTALGSATTRGCRGLIEVEAESVAFLVSTRFGLDSATTAFPYVASWAEAANPADPAAAVAATAQRVVAAAQRIIDHVENYLGLAEEPAPTLTARVLAGQERTAALCEQSAPAPNEVPVPAVVPGEQGRLFRTITDRPAEAVPAGRLVAAHADAVAFYRAQLGRHDGPRNYLTARGLGVLVERDWPWQVGYAPRSWTALLDHLHAAGYSTAELHAAGLVTKTRDGRPIDAFRDRIMFPLRDATGRPVAFIGRAGPGAGDDVPKYLNSPQTSIYDKGRMLFGLAEQSDRISAGWTPALVEGPTDTIAVWMSYARNGRSGVVALAPCGTAMTAEQLDIVAAMPGATGRGLLVAFDGDVAGRRAVDRTLGLAQQRGVAVRAIEFASGVDPAELARDPAGLARLRNTLQRQARPLVDVVVDHRLDRLVARHPRLFEDFVGRLAGVRAVAPLLAWLPAADSMRLVPHIAARTGASIDTVTAAVVTAIEEGPPARSRQLETQPRGAAAGFPALRLDKAVGPGQSPAPTPPAASAVATHRAR